MIDLRQKILRVTCLDEQHEQPGSKAGLDFIFGFGFLSILSGAPAGSAF
jgi:hypothetical protein